MNVLARLGCLFAFWCLTACGAAKTAQSDCAARPPERKLNKRSMRRLADFACTQKGVPYKWGGTTPKGFDCSGFTTYCFDQFCIKLPRTAAEQSTAGKKIGKRRARPGDLIFFKGADKKHKKTEHVGIVVSGKGGHINFVHAGSKGITQSALNEAYFKKRFKMLRRVRR